MKKKTTKKAASKKATSKKKVAKKVAPKKKEAGALSRLAVPSAHRSQRKRPRGVKQLTPRPIGRVSHYFDKIKVAAIKLTSPIKKGDAIRIEGGATVVKLKVASLQKNHKPVASAKARDEIGVKVPKKVREGYRVYKQ